MTLRIGRTADVTDLGELTRSDEGSEFGRSFSRPWNSVQVFSSAAIQRSAHKWHGPGESDCLIKTKHCDGPSGRWRSVISAKCSDCQHEKFKLAQVNGGSNYDSLKVDMS